MGNSAFDPKFMTMLALIVLFCSPAVYLILKYVLEIKKHAMLSLFLRLLFLRLPLGIIF